MAQSQYKDLLLILDANLLRTIITRGEPFESKARNPLDQMKISCFRAAIMNLDDSIKFPYNPRNEKEVKLYNEYAEELRKLGFRVIFDGDEGYEYMLVTWYINPYSE